MADGGTSPYVTIYMARRQAEATLRALHKAADGLAPSNPLRAAIRTIEQAVKQ